MAVLETAVAERETKGERTRRRIMDEARAMIDEVGIDIVAESIAWLGPLSPIAAQFLRGVIGSPPGQQQSGLAAEGRPWN